jgi:hypothetical protein
LGRLVRAVLSLDYAGVVKAATERLEAEDRAEDERYDRLVKERMASLEATFDEEDRKQPKSHQGDTCLKAKYVGTGYRHGIAGKAYPRGEDQYRFQPDTGAMGVRVKADDLEFLESKASE